MYHIQLAQQNKQPFSYFHKDDFWNLRKKEPVPDFRPRVLHRFSPPDMIFESAVQPKVQPKVQPIFFGTFESLPVSSDLTPYACPFSPRSV